LEWREWIRNGGAMEEVVLVAVREVMSLTAREMETHYILTSSSHFGPVFQSSVAK
jgi:hypothetical protein